MRPFTLLDLVGPAAAAHLGGVLHEQFPDRLCMILGAGWPFHLGGITPYLDHSGVAERVTTRRFGS